MARTAPSARSAVSPFPDPQSADAWINRFFRIHSRTFSFATRLLPRNIRMPVAVLYLYCRTVDDIADDRVRLVGPDAAMEELEALSADLEATLAGRPPDGVLWPRLAGVVHAWSLRPGPFRELIDGARRDIVGTHIEDLDDLVAYSELVAGSIGEMVLPLLAADHGPFRGLVAPARTLGVAMQLTNVLRDVGEDRRTLSRVYLPRTWLVQAGLDETSQPDPADPRYRSLLERLMREAENRYGIGLAGVEQLPTVVRTGIRAAGRVYREILNEIRANEYDNLTRRAVVPFRRKALRTAGDGYASRRERLMRSLRTSGMP